MPTLSDTKELPTHSQQAVEAIAGIMDHPLSQATGYGVVLGLGKLITTTWVNRSVLTAI